MTLKRFLLKVDTDFEKKLSKKFPDGDFNKILSTSLEEIKGECFYRIAVLILPEFDSTVINTFQTILEKKREIFLLKQGNTRPKESNTNKRFIRQFMVLQEDIADKAYIDHTRLSKLVNKAEFDFYAWEIVSIAVSNNISPLRAFSQLYNAE